MKITAPDIWRAIEKIREKAPLIHNITNYVVMNTTANALLAIGASPVMAHAIEEVEEMVAIAGALVMNIGTLSDKWVESMFRAAGEARKRNVPIVLDPVGAGATRYRTETAQKLIKTVPPSIIRGNASEIMALLEKGARTKGVDSTALSHAALDAARDLNKAHGSVISISGETDYVIDNDIAIEITNGHPMMSRVTGLGCTASALCGAFAAVNSNYAQAAAQAMAVMGIAGEIAAETAAGPGSLQPAFLDTLYCLTESDIKKRLRAE
jgi:hydroxyethylthiazole kinase